MPLPLRVHEGVIKCRLGKAPFKGKSENPLFICSGLPVLLRRKLRSNQGKPKKILRKAKQAALTPYSVRSTPYPAALTLLRPYFSSHSRCARKKNWGTAG